jgi:hypothetical protein
MPSDSAGTTLVPLRSTWKSKAETAAAVTAPSQPEPETLPEPPQAQQPTPRPRQVEPPVVKSEPVPEPEPELEPLAEAEEQQTREPEPADPETAETEAAAEEASEIEADETDETDETDGSEEGEEGADQFAADDSAIVARLAAVAEAVPGERSPRTSLFGTRKPAADPGRAAPGVAAKPVERAVRPGEPVTRVRAPAPRPAEAPRPRTPPPEEFATSRPAMPRMATTEPPPARTERRERPRIAARVATAAPAPTAATAISGADQEVLDSAIRLIMQRATELSASVDPDEKVPVDLILEHCRETTEKVIEALSGSRSDGVQRIRGDLGEIQDLIMLMQLEKGHAPADDAITLLLQIRRDLETLRAA